MTGLLRTERYHGIDLHAIRRRQIGDETPGEPRVVILSYQAWRLRYGGVTGLGREQRVD